MTPLEQLGVTIPIVQAPMAGVSTPELAAAVSNAGGLGSIGIGATDAAGALTMIEATRARTDRPYNVNLFVHATAQASPAREQAWLDAMRPLFERFDAEPPAALRTIYKSFADDDEMLAMLVQAAPPVISFHFGLPALDRIEALKQAGCVLLATATSLAEARAAEKAGIDMVIAQGWEAGGHRGVFDPAAPDDQLGTMALVRLVVEQSALPAIAAGGIMDGAGIRAALALGAVAAQLGTAFIACPESSADTAYREALAGAGASHTAMTRAISGRPARCLANRFTEWEASAPAEVPDYPIAYDAGKALNAAAKAAGENGFGAQWAGQGAPLSRTMAAADLVALLAREATLAA
ncbi:NAD(P)H-dependent flavin oxidoreductase [Sphingomonas aerophila]|uniref:Nitronate monooxygenase n=1 Tax=Sphingomonas aerophila TaxID=1344948 RepID=A0A7W9BG31_9SPHN|nr:nitronate monooxygenase [Sphingomonas aerophila]MBB5716492.1 nitronate monooxygenase [Sphingomonas aerophila]